MNRANSSSGPLLHTLSHNLHPVSARTRELPNNYLYIVKKQYIGSIVKLRNRPSRQLFDFAIKELINTESLAYQRFVDNVPMGIDRTLVRGVTRGLERVPLSGPGVNGPDGYKRCKMLLSELEEIAERRSELEKRQKRLLSAKDELIEVFV